PTISLAMILDPGRVCRPRARIRATSRWSSAAEIIAEDANAVATINDRAKTVVEDSEASGPTMDDCESPRSSAGAFSTFEVGAKAKRFDCTRAAPSSAVTRTRTRVMSVAVGGIARFSYAVN